MTNNTKEVKLDLDKSQNCLLRGKMKQVKDLLEKETSRLLRVCGELSDVTKGHSNTRARINRMLTWANGNPALLMCAFREIYAPSVAKTYGYTLRALHPTLMSGEEPRRILTRIAKDGGVLKTTRAVPFTATEIRVLLEKMSPRAVFTAMIMWISASRLSDLEKIHKVTKHPGRIVGLHWNVWKSDKTGDRAFAKFLCLPLSTRWDATRLVGLRELNSCIHQIFPNRTSYSLRRGSTTWLANHGTPFTDIQLLTGHTPTHEASKSVRRYVDPSPNQPESVKQLYLSRKLGTAVSLAY